MRLLKPKGVTLLYKKAKFIFLVLALPILTYISVTGVNTVKGVQNFVDNADAKVSNSLYPHPERNLKTAHRLQVELAEITTACATRAAVNLTYSCNNFLINYQSVLNKFFHNKTTPEAWTMPLEELEKKVDTMLGNCNTIECYHRVGLFVTKINQLFIEKAEDLLVITGQITFLNRLPSA